MLVLRLILVPALIAVVTLATRRWGPTVGGLLMALPVVAGPTLAFYAVDQGNRFAAEAAEATLLGLVAVAGFCISYARAARRWKWPFSLVIGWSVFGVVSSLLSGARFHVLVNLTLALLALVLARRIIDASGTPPSAVARPKWDLPLRMLTAAMLVFVLTSLAERLGPAVSGVLTPFPVVTAIFAAFTHAQAGPVAVARFLRGFIPGLCTFAIFCVVLSAGLRMFSLPVAFSLALILQIACQAVVLWRSLAAAPSNPRLTPTPAEPSRIGHE